MKVIKVLGTGCPSCVKTAELIEKTAREMGVDAEVVKETDPQAIMSYGVMSTPAVVLNEQVVHAGGMPSVEQIKQWLAES